MGHLTLGHLVPQNFQQFFRRILGEDLSELGAVIFYHADAFDNDIVDFPAATLVGKPIEKRYFGAVRRLQIALNFSSTLLEHDFLLEENFLI